MAPSVCMWVADAYLAQGLYDDALAMIDTGLDLGVSTRQHYYDAPLHRVKAEILLADDRQPEDARNKAAEDEFRQAIDAAQAQESKWFELRASIGLAGLLLARSGVTMPERVSNRSSRRSAKASTPATCSTLRCSPRSVREHCVLGILPVGPHRSRTRRAIDRHVV